MKTPHCGVYCHVTRRGFVHFHSGSARFKRFHKKHRKLRPYVKPGLDPHKWLKPREAA